jgi:hypothetical protein
MLSRRQLPRRLPRGIGSHRPGSVAGPYDSFKGKVRQQFQWRTREQVARFFTGMDLVEAGLVRVDDWRQEPGTDGTRKSAMWAAVGRKS